MECNKEEAIRAKGIAEKMMLDKDFSAARKIILKAQKLNEELEDLSKMLVVCDVHCSADQALFGNQNDYYGILQLDHTADDEEINGQYKKFALQLHPDKNKLPGAEAAFKLIDEAKKILLDKGQRILYDCRCRKIMGKPTVENAKRKRIVVEEEEPSDSVSSNDINDGLNKGECLEQSDRPQQKAACEDDDNVDIKNSPQPDKEIASSSPAPEMVNGIGMEENASKVRKLSAADAKNQNEVKKEETLESIEETKGCSKFDPSCLPKNSEEIAAPEDMTAKVDDNETDYSSCFEDNTDIDGSDVSSDSSEVIAILEPEFFKFEEVKDIEKFKVGQIWSLYCDEDTLPKYYGKITKVLNDEDFRLNVLWLESKTTLPGYQIPISCGNFKVKRGRPQSYTSTGPFSHQVAVHSVGKDEYRILPSVGEVWALYKNWSTDMKLADLKTCEYDVVEVTEEKEDSYIKVSVLEWVDGFSAVFKPQLKEGSPVTNTISCKELFKFSHRIPSFRLKKQRSGSLKGFWEIDRAALPDHYFR
ncbi:hypothetical protein Tsubulata_011590 [Turnera subulata]|uniref:J domain-containing protein n=1 Tax=Turnera subulata TaxID=218843 RepID=A0A9Q0JQ83_9ROSI|nr:hypothetical protein Tsubulata_011590 [Turnera subulata]